MKNSFSKILVLLIVILVAAMIRFWAAPRSAGPDIPQFWSFAKVFSDEGFKFYTFAGADREVFPYKGWSYNYTPIWLLILYDVYLLAEPDDATTQFVDVSWRVGMKIPLIISDLVIARWLRYQVPLIYAFSGIGSFLTYVHDVTGKDTLFIMQGMKEVQLISFLLIGFLIFKRKICLPRAALLGFFVLLGLSSSVHYQYLVGYIPLALYWASRTTFSEEKFLLLLLSIYPSLWLWTFDVGFWFRFMQPTIEGSQELLRYWGLTREALPDGFYVCFVVALMFFFLSYIFGTILRWSEKKDTTTSTNS